MFIYAYPTVSVNDDVPENFGAVCFLKNGTLIIRGFCVVAVIAMATAPSCDDRRRAAAPSAFEFRQAAFSWLLAPPNTV